MSSGRLSGPAPTSVWAVTVTRYSVHFSKFFKRYWELSGGMLEIWWVVVSFPSVAVYWMVYCVMIPFCSSTGGGRQLTRILVELGLEHLTSSGGPEGSGWWVGFGAGFFFFFVCGLVWSGRSLNFCFKGVWGFVLIGMMMAELTKQNGKKRRGKKMTQNEEKSTRTYVGK